MKFKILGGLAYRHVPWAMVEPHRKQAEDNHNDKLERINERGGLSYDELVAVLEDRPYKRMTPTDAFSSFSRHMRDFLRGGHNDHHFVRDPAALTRTKSSVE